MKAYGNIWIRGSLLDSILEKVSFFQDIAVSFQKQIKKRKPELALLSTKCDMQDRKMGSN